MKQLQAVQMDQIPDRGLDRLWPGSGTSRNYAQTKYKYHTNFDMTWTESDVIR